MSTELELEARIKKLEDEGEESKKKAELARVNAEAEKQGRLFIQKHLEIGDYNNCDANNNMLGNYIRQKNLSWTVETLEEAFAAEKDRLVPPVVPEEKTYPWPAKEWGTIQGLKSAEPRAYKSFWFDKKHGTAFRAWVDEILARGV